MRNKQVEFNPYIYTLKNCPVLAIKYQFLIHNRAVFRRAAGAAGSYERGMVSRKKGYQNFSKFMAAENTGSVNILQ